MVPANKSLESVLHQTLFSNFHDFLSLVHENKEIKYQGDVGMLHKVRVRVDIYSLFYSILI